MLSWQNKYEYKKEKGTNQMSELSYEFSQTSNKEILAVDAMIEQL